MGTHFRDDGKLNGFPRELQVPLEKACLRVVVNVYQIGLFHSLVGGRQTYKSVAFLRYRGFGRDSFCIPTCYFFKFLAMLKVLPDFTPSFSIPFNAVGSLLLSLQIF